MATPPDKESFQEFISSFFYGKRWDLSFKFMSDLRPEEASGFLTVFFKDIAARSFEAYMRMMALARGAADTAAFRPTAGASGGMHRVRPGF